MQNKFREELLPCSEELHPPEQLICPFWRQKKVWGKHGTVDDQ